MPYAPAVHIVGACDLMFLSGATPSPLYHKHPHVDAEHVHPHSIEEQTKRAMEAIKSILDHTGASWRDVVKVTKYFTDFREADAMHATMAKYFGDWRPASTTVCINQLSSPGARIELDMIVALPKKARESASTASRAHCRGGLSRAFPPPKWRATARPSKRCSREHECDHLVFCGANRVGSAVQWLTQWPVTAEAVGVLTPGQRDALFVQ